MADYGRITIANRLDNESQWTLRDEIRKLKDTLVQIDLYNSQPLDSISENINRISDVLKISVEKKHPIQSSSSSYPYNPLHELLDVGPLTRIEIPLDLLDMFISNEYDVNSTRIGKTCLDIAVEKKHYQAIRHLVKKHGARAADISAESPISFLAAQPNVPLDVIELLATPQNLNDAHVFYGTPLHRAAYHGHATTSLHLIKLGASVDQIGLSTLPIGCYLRNIGNQFNNELFRNLLPQKGHGGEILHIIICYLFGNKHLDENDKCLLEMFHQLLQRLHFNEPLVLDVPISYEVDYLHIHLNNITVADIRDSRSLYSAYIGCLILVELQFDLASTPDDLAYEIQGKVLVDLTYAHAIDDMLRNYRQQRHVKSLLRLCVLRTRKSMRSLDDESFLSLPVPPYIRKLLTYRDVAEKIFVEVIKDKLRLY